VASVTLIHHGQTAQSGGLPVPPDTRERIAGAEVAGWAPPTAPGGYAISGLTLRGGERVHGLKITFMRWAGDKLDPTRPFQTRWFGGFGDGKEVTLGNDGKLVVGLHGRAGEGIENLGVVQLRKKIDNVK